MPVPVVKDLSQPSSETNPALQWLRLYGDSLFAKSLRSVRRRDVAEDLVQETLLAGLQSLDQFAHRADVRTWLTGILHHKINDYLRARYRNEKIATCDLDDDAMFTSRGSWKTPVRKWNVDPHRAAEQKELGVAIDSCISKLPNRMAHLFAVRAREESTIAELCEQLQITPENAWMLLHRARLRLRKCMTTNWFSNDAGHRK